MRYEFDDTVAEQRFSVVNVDDDRLSELAAAARMRFERL
jgi:hypothetical protein